MVLEPPSRDRLHVQLFGGPRLFRDDLEIGLSPYQAHLLTVVYGAGGFGVRRDEAISRLWPDGSPATARRRLNQLLYALRKKAESPDLIRSLGDELRKAGSGVSDDLAAFENATDSRGLRDCVELVHLGFGVRFLERGSRDYQDWVQGRSAELRRQTRRKAEAHYHARRRTEDWSEAAAAAELLLAFSPSEESQLQRLLEAKTRAGKPVEAEEAFREFFRRPDREGRRPDPETEKLMEGVRSAIRQTPGQVGKEIYPAVPEPPLLGRDEEQKALRRFLSSTPQKDLRRLLVLGEAGIGKTRLIGEALISLPLGAQRVLRAEAAELEQMIPLNPLIELFGGEDASRALLSLEEPWRTVLLGVMPRHFPGDGPVPEAPHIQSGSVPRRLFEAFFRLLQAMVREKPLVLVLEDIQWVDETTLTVLEFLLRRWDSGGLQLIVSARTEELRREPTLRSFLENFRVHPEALEIHLPDLGPLHGAALIKHLAGDPLAEESVSQLQALAGGNPFFLIELTLEFVAGRLGPMETPHDLVQIPLSVRQVLDRRLSQLSPTADLLLGALAVFSRPLETRGLVWIAQIPGSECMAGLDQLQDFRLVRHRNHRLVVSHELVRHTVYQGLRPTRRAWLHERVARHILNVRETPPPDELAVHFHHAGLSNEARSYATEAADHAEASGAIPEALRFLRLAREHSSDPETVADLIGRMGHLNYLHQNLDEAAPLLELAAQRFRRQGQTARALRSEIERIDCLAQRGNPVGMDYLDELQLLKAEARSKALWGEFNDALNVEAHSQNRAGNLPGIRNVLLQAQEHMHRGCLEAQCKGHAMVALNIYFGNPDDGLPAARRAVQIAKETNDPDLLLHALNRLMVALHYKGALNTKEGAEAFELAEDLIGTCGDLILKFHIRLNRAVWHLEVGELSEANRGFSIAEELVRGTNAHDAKAMLELNLGELALASHDFPAGLAAFRKAESLISESSPHFFSTMATAGAGLCSLSSGNLADARARESELPSAPDFWTFDPFLVAVFKARMLLKRQDARRAWDLLQTVREDVKDRLVPSWIRLTIEEANLRRRSDRPAALTLVNEGLEYARGFGVPELERQLESLRSTLSTGT